MNQLKRLSSLNLVESFFADDTIVLSPSTTALFRDADKPAVRTRCVSLRRESGEQPATRTVRQTAEKSRIVGVNAVVKRLFDLGVGSLALLFLSPFLLLVALAIKLESKGPVFFYQHRSGRNGESIKVFKFRSMYQDHSCTVPTTKTFIQTKKNDPRITRLGVFLRRTSVDELPQLFNVLLGSMSLVGPRPHPAPLDEKFEPMIPALKSRYAVKSGITGWAQVNGFRGETTGVEDMMARVEHDRHYIKNWSLLLDLKIIAMTVVKGWVHRNAY